MTGDRQIQMRLGAWAQPNEWLGREGSMMDVEMFGPTGTSRQPMLILAVNVDDEGRVVLDLGLPTGTAQELRATINADREP